MRVMVVVMVPRQHEELAYESVDASSIAKIRWAESGFVMGYDSNAQPSAPGPHAQGSDGSAGRVL